ncbi:leucine--tRNA ligase [Deferribacterales bacterium RsTz2092]|nr:leucine--tRNA ligase [Deferribacterales bacterium]
MKYNFAEFEEKWQNAWEMSNVFKVEIDKTKPKYYCLEMFPYPSGNIHMGHLRNYAIGDVTARYKTMRGFNVIHPIGWDAFGLPAENAAKQNNRHPAEWTFANIEKMKHQLKQMGLSYDWSREVATCTPEYYKWEQELFIKMWERGLAYKRKSFVNWCPSCETVLANEQVEDGKCWRCSSEVFQKELSQWCFKITNYADELLENTYSKLSGNWPEKVLVMQRNWIGKSTGAEIVFDVSAEQDKTGVDEKITVFSTRPDTLYGATFMLLAAEHPLSKKLIAGTKYEPDGLKFIEEITSETKENRTNDKAKKGFFTGRYCINPANGAKLPIYIANYVLIDYGTGAVMAVPAHDERDFDFATKYKLPIIQVIDSGNAEPLTEAYTGDGKLINSDKLNGLSVNEAKVAISEILENNGSGKKTTTYRLRDWGISRQRYWGAPIPFVYCDNCGIVSVPVEQLPVELPKDIDFRVNGNPLESSASFVNTTCPKCGAPARRETDTMDTFVESSWYFLRYCSPHHTKDMFDKDSVAYWAPIDQYIGGVEHAVMHLLYARFYTMVLRDFGYVSFAEPFTRLLTQGMVCKETEHCDEHGWLYPSEVQDGKCIKCGKPVKRGRVEKMSKSKKNVVDPDELLRDFGADTIRLFSLFAAPPEKEIEWSQSGVEGCYRFINRVYRLVDAHIELLNSNITPLEKPAGGVSVEILRQTHTAIKRVTADIERFQLNTAVAAIMEFVNALYVSQTELASDTDKGAFKFAIVALLKLLAPFTPHIAEELWERTGNNKKVKFISRADWLDYDETVLERDEVTFVVQVNGKLRAQMSLPKTISEQDAVVAALKDDKVQAHIAGKEIVKKIYVPLKLVNIVVK